MKVKKIALLLALALLLTSCGKLKEKTEADEVVYRDITVSKTQNEFLALEDGFLTKDDEGVKDIKKNDDGSITYTLSEELIEEFKEVTTEDTDKLIKDFTENKESYPAFYTITYNDELTKFTIGVDPVEFQEIDEEYASILFAYGNLYQLFDGVADEDLQTSVVFINKDTEQELKTIVSTDFHEEVLPQ